MSYFSSPNQGLSAGAPAAGGSMARPKYGLKSFPQPVGGLGVLAEQVAQHSSAPNYAAPSIDAPRRITYDPNASPSAGNWAPSATNATAFAAKSGPGPAQADISRFMRTDGVVPAAQQRGPSLEGPTPDGRPLSQYVREGGGARDGEIGFGAFKPAPTPRPDPWAYLGDAMKGYQGNIDKLNGMENPWESTMSLGALDRSRAGLAAQGARAGVHDQNDAIKQMMAGGGLIAQGDLNNMSDNMRAGVTNQQNALYADYNKNRIGWGDQRQELLATQYDRMAGLAALPGQMEAQGYRNRIGGQDAYEYTTQDAANQRAALREFEYKGAKYRDEVGAQDAYEYTKDESANMRGLSRVNAAKAGTLANDAANATNYENNETRGARLAQVGLSLGLSQAQAKEAQWRAENQGLAAAIQFITGIAPAAGSILGKR